VNSDSAVADVIVGAVEGKEMGEGTGIGSLSVGGGGMASVGGGGTRRVGGGGGGPPGRKGKGSGEADPIG
jgi:hypothetical protein